MKNTALALIVSLTSFPIGETGINAFAADACHQENSLKIGIGNCSRSFTGFAGLYSKDQSDPATPEFSRLTKQLPNSPVTLAPIDLLKNMHGTGTQTNTNMLVKLQSENKQLSEFGPDNPAKIIIRCRHSELNVLVQFPGYEMTDKEGVRDVAYKLDNKPPMLTRFSPSDNHSIVGHWQNKRAVQFIRQLTGHKKLQLSSITVNNAKVHAEFDVSKIGRKLVDLPQTCLSQG